MKEQPVHLVLKLDTSEPIELSAFVGAFVSLGNEFDRYIREDHPDLKSEAQIYVKEVRAGCIEADMFPWLVAAAPFISEMDKVLIVEDFVRRWGRRVTSFIDHVRHDQPSSKAELADFTNAVVAIATDPDASSTLSAATFEDKEKQVRVSFKLTTPDARAALRSIEIRKQELDRKSGADHERVLMSFTRSDVNNAEIGKRSGERVKIEEISGKPLALMYGSTLAEERIKHEIREADDNVYKKGFVVDVNVKLHDGRPVAYAVTNLHEVIDLLD